MGMEDLFELEAPVSAPRSSVPFRGRLFAFVLQTSRLFFTWHRPRCIFPSYIFSPASHWLGCFITDGSLFLTGYCQRTLSKFRIKISNVPTTTSTDHHKTGRPQYNCSARTLLLLRPAASSPVPPPPNHLPPLQHNKAISII